MGKKYHALIDTQQEPYCPVPAAVARVRRTGFYPKHSKVAWCTPLRDMWFTICSRLALPYLNAQRGCNCGFDTPANPLVLTIPVLTYATMLHLNYLLDRHPLTFHLNLAHRETCGSCTRTCSTQPRIESDNSCC